MATVLIEKESNNQISVKFVYHPGLVMKIKEIDGRSWHPEKKYWTVPNTRPVIE